MNPINPKELSIEALKALGFDILKDIQRLQNSLQIINNEIESRNSVASKKEKKEEK